MDVTCPDTFVPLYSSSATSETGSVEFQVEERKEAKYSPLNPEHSFSPVAIEASEVGSEEPVASVKTWTMTGAYHWGSEVHNFLIQRRSVAVSVWQFCISTGNNGLLCH